MSDDASGATDLTAVLLKHAEDRGYIDVWFDLGEFAIVPLLSVVLTVGVVVWFFRGRLAASELRKVRATTDKIKGESLATRQDLLAKLDEISDRLCEMGVQSCGLLADLRNVVGKSGYKLLREKRDVILAFHSGTHMPQFINYLQYCHQLLETTEFRHRIQEQLLPWAQSQRAVITILNSEGVIGKISTAAQYRVRKSEINSLFERMLSTTPCWDLRYRSIRKEILNERKNWQKFERLSKIE